MADHSPGPRTAAGVTVAQTALLIDLLRRSPTFSELRRDDLEELAAVSEIRQYPAGKVLFREGEPARELFVVYRGAVRITDGSGVGGMPVAEFTEGQSLAEIDLLAGSVHRRTAVTIAPSALLRLPAAGLEPERLMREHAALFARVLSRQITLVAHSIRETNRLISTRTPWIRQLETALYRDALTGLPNRRYLEERMPEAFSGETRRIGILMIKPDNFKQVNDTLGHEAGDRALREIAATVARAVSARERPATDLPCVVRYRGDELAVVLFPADLRRLRAMAETIRRALRSRKTLREPVRLTWSMAAAAARHEEPHEQWWSELLSRVHALLFDALRRGPESYAEWSAKDEARRGAHE